LFNNREQIKEYIQLLSSDFPEYYIENFLFLIFLLFIITDES